MKRRITTITLVFIHLLAVFSKVASSNKPPQCPSPIYCHGSLLHTIQMSKIFSDSKTFVDMPLKQSPEITLKNFEKFMEESVGKPTSEQIRAFVHENFQRSGSELETYIPKDWHENPRFLDRIANPIYKKWGAGLHGLWQILGRKMKDDIKNNPQLYSIIDVPNPFIVPGGRFREFYYWDTYWVIRGLLFSEMYETTRGILENFLHIVQTYGYIPNGGRTYYAGRSQPPLLTPMVKAYLDFTKNTSFVVKNLPTLEKEFQYWINVHLTEVDGHKMFLYKENTSGPRPESYREDIETCGLYKNNTDVEECYAQLKAAAESGMDFSSRWFIDSKGTNTGGLKNLKTTFIVPVELNAILCWNAKLLAEFNIYANNEDKAKEYEKTARGICEAIQAVLWNEEDGIWYDYDMINKKPRNYFVPTNVAPLWTMCFDVSKSQELSSSVLNYLLNIAKVDDYPGGVPNTLNPSGEQWDYPNVWPPMQYILVKALENLRTPESLALAHKWMDRWLESNHEAYLDGQHMYEKYSGDKFGGHGGGGEYEIQIGFGWSNGIDIEFLSQRGSEI